MKKLIFFLILAILTGISGLSKAQESESQSFHPQRIVIKFKTGSPLLSKIKSIVPNSISESFDVKGNTVNDPELNNFFSNCRIQSIKAARPGSSAAALPGGIDRIFIAEIESGSKPDDIIKSLSGLAFIEYAEKDFIVRGSGVQVNNEYSENGNVSVIPNDPNFNLQWGLRNTGQVINGFAGVPGADINIAGGWDITTGNTNTKIAILDSGIPLAASEFSGRITPGYDFANNDNDPTDDQGHGTNVTSIAAAKGNNASLVAGVNWNCRIMPVKILDENNSGFYTWWISGTIMAADSGAKVMNMSVGGSSFSQALQDAITYANSLGAITVACMMNNDNNVPYYPAAFNNVIAIGAINNRNNRAVPFCWGGGSSYGSHIDFCAPGEMILGVNAFNTNQANYWCGTSQATPMVTGLVSLMLGLNPNLTFTQIYDLIKQNAVDQIGPPAEDSLGFDSYFGWGRINAQATLNSVPVSVINYSSNIPDKFSLHQNFPNPFNPVTKIRFDVPSGINAGEGLKLIVYDAIGKEITTLVDQKLSEGSYEVSWNAGNNSSGIYFYTLSSGEFTQTKKMTVIK